MTIDAPSTSICETLNIRIKAAKRAAEEALLDGALFVVGPEADAELLARWDAPPAPNARLGGTLQAPSPWE